MDISCGMSQPQATVMQAVLVGKILKKMMTNQKDASASLKRSFIQLAAIMLLILKIHLSVILKHLYPSMIKVLPGSENMNPLCSAADFNQPIRLPMLVPLLKYSHV